MMMAGPCTGLRVLDVSRSLAATLTTMFLADYGAEVTLVEPPDGHPLRAETGFLVWGRGKRSVRADLETQGHTIVPTLAGSADILVESFGPGELERIGLDLTQVRQDNPRLIVCSMPCFAQSDPDAALAAEDAVAAARAGIMSAQPGFRPGPAYVRPPLSSYGAALLALQALGAALVSRERDGRGRHFSIPLLNGALAMQVSHLLEVERGDPFPAPRRTALDGRPLYRLYQCQDGRWLHFGVLTPRFWPGVALAAGHPEWISDPRYETMPNLPTAAEREAFIEMLSAEIEQKPYAEWARLLDEQGVPFAPAQTVEEFLREPQLEAVDMLVELDDPRVGRLKQMGLPIQFQRTPGAIEAPAPLLGQHDEEIRGQGGDRPAASRQAAQGSPGGSAPLDGIRILDCSSFIAGPLGPAFLADLGADVIKIESPEGDGLRGGRGFLGWNRGKRGLALDLKRPEAREVIYRLVERADVFLENMRPRVAERLGIGYEDLRRHNPRLIYCSVTAYGSSGPCRDKPGFDPLMQALSGIERAQGGHHHPPVFLLVPVTDNTCAMLNAVGIALALYERERSGLGQKLETSLIRAGALLQSDTMLEYDGRPPPPVNDAGQFGPHAHYRLYQCADGWIFLAANPEHRSKLMDVFGLANLKDTLRAEAANGWTRIDDYRLAEGLSEHLAQERVQSAIEQLRSQGLPVVQVTESYQQRFAEDPRLRTPDLIVTYWHPTFGRVRQPAALARLSDPPASMTRAAPLIGEHTREILTEAGYDATTISDLILRGIACEPSGVDQPA